MNHPHFDPATLADREPVLYRRFLYKGLSRYTTISTGEQSVDYETISIVQSFFKEGDRYGLIPKYKLGYILGNGDLGLKLSLQPGATSPHRAVTPSLPLQIRVSIGGDNAIGGLYQHYEQPVAGTVEMWSDADWSGEKCWRYSGFWGGPVERPYTDPLGVLPPTGNGGPHAMVVDGWGLKTGRQIVRTMSYSTIVDEERVAIFVRSSELTAVTVDEQTTEFDTFYD